MSLLKFRFMISAIVLQSLLFSALAQAEEKKAVVLSSTIPEKSI